MKLYHILSALCLTLLCCNSKKSIKITIDLQPNFTILTDDEKKGINEVKIFYNDNCEYGKDSAVTSNNKKINSFWIKISANHKIDSLKQDADIPASNIAFIFYRNLAAQKAQYTHIRSELIFVDGSKVKYTYPVLLLNQVINKKHLADRVIDWVVNKKYEQIKRLIKPDSAVKTENAEAIITKLVAVGNSLGNIYKFSPLGFRVTKTTNGQGLLHVIGVLQGSVKSQFLVLNIDLDNQTDNFYGFGYKL